MIKNVTLSSKSVKICVLLKSRKGVKGKNAVSFNGQIRLSLSKREKYVRITREQKGAI